MLYRRVAARPGRGSGRSGRPRRRGLGRSARSLTGRGALLALGLWALPRAAMAYRPFDSTDADVAARGELDVELGPLGYLVEGPTRSVVAPSLALSWGFADRWEAVAEGRGFVGLGRDAEAPRLRLEDTGVSMKRLLRAGSLQERPGPSLAAEAGALLPAIHGQPGVGASGALVLSQRWPDLTLHASAAAAWTREHRPAVLGGLIVEGHDAWAVRPAGEILVEQERGMPTTVSGLLGLIWRVSGPLSLDAAVRSARAGGLRTTEIRAGLTWSVAVGAP